MEMRDGVGTFFFTGALGIHENVTLAVRIGVGFSASANIDFPWRSALTHVI